MCQRSWLMFCVFVSFWVLCPFRLNVSLCWHVQVSEICLFKLISVSLWLFCLFVVVLSLCYHVLSLCGCFVYLVCEAVTESHNSLQRHWTSWNGCSEHSRVSWVSPTNLLFVKTCLEASETDDGGRSHVTRGHLWTETWFRKWDELLRTLLSLFIMQQRLLLV